MLEACTSSQLQRSGAQSSAEDSSDAFYASSVDCTVHPAAVPSRSSLDIAADSDESTPSRYQACVSMIRCVPAPRAGYQAAREYPVFVWQRCAAAVSQQLPGGQPKWQEGGDHQCLRLQATGIPARGQVHARTRQQQLLGLLLQSVIWVS